MCRKINDYPAIIESGLPSIASIKKRYGSDFIQAYIEGWIINIREFIVVGKKMNDVQTVETAFLIVETYHSINIADINMIFKNAKLGKYGTTYDRLDGQIILSWFEKHFNERCECAANLSMREADKYKGSHNIASFEKITGLNDKLKFK